MSAIGYESMVEQLTAIGVPRDKAEARARAEYPELAAALDRNAQRREDILEKEEQRIIMNMARAIGFKVYNLSQPRASKQTPGIGDLWMSKKARSFAGWWETKRQVGGERSSEQVDFGDECLAGSVPYGYGDRYHFAEWLQHHGFTPPTIPA